MLLALRLVLLTLSGFHLKNDQSSPTSIPLGYLVGALSAQFSYGYAK